MKANDHWNYWRLQLHWNELDWLDSNTRDPKNNPLCSYTLKFYIKYGKKTCYFVGH